MKIKMRIARIIDRLFKKACWADLAMWAMGYKDFETVDFSGQCCKGGCYFLAETGGCYCGKNRVGDA